MAGRSNWRWKMSLLRNSVQTIQRVLGNQEPVGAILLDIDGVVHDVSGLTILFRMILMLDSTVKIDNAAAAIDDGPTGKVSYTFQAVDVDTTGLYAMYFIDDTAIDRLWPYDGARFQLDLQIEADSV